MQRNEIKAFRQRLVRAGFRNIMIYRFGYNSYQVSCISSSGLRINRTMTLYEIINTPCVVWFD